MILDSIQWGKILLMKLTQNRIFGWPEKILTSNKKAWRKSKNYSTPNLPSLTHHKPHHHITFLPIHQLLLIYQKVLTLGQFGQIAHLYKMFEINLIVEVAGLSLLWKQWVIEFASIPIKPYKLDFLHKIWLFVVIIVVQISQGLVAVMEDLTIMHGYIIYNREL